MEDSAFFFRVKGYRLRCAFLQTFDYKNMLILHIHELTWHNIIEDLNLYRHRYENLKFCPYFLFHISSSTMVMSATCCIHRTLQKLKP